MFLARVCLRLVEVDEEGVLQLGHDVLLTHDVALLPRLHDHALAHSLQSISLAGLEGEGGGVVVVIIAVCVVAAAVVVRDTYTHTHHSDPFATVTGHVFWWWGW